MDLESLDPLGNDWKARGERGTARIRERAVLRDAGELVPVAAIEAVLVGLAGTVQGVLAGIIDEARSKGASHDLMERLSEIVVDAQLQVSLAMDSAVDGAVKFVDEMESIMTGEDGLGAIQDAPPPKPSKKNRDTIATTRPRVKRA